jgi:hypothetical protein
MPFQYPSRDYFQAVEDVQSHHQVLQIFSRKDTEGEMPASLM